MWGRRHPWLGLVLMSVPFSRGSSAGLGTAAAAPTACPRPRSGPGFRYQKTAQAPFFSPPPPGSSSAEHLKICVILYQQSVPLRNSLRLLYLNRPCPSHEPLGSQPLALTQQKSRSPSSTAVPALLPLPQEHGRTWDFIFPNTHPCRGAELHPGMSPYCPAPSTCSVSRGISGTETTPSTLGQASFSSHFPPKRLLEWVLVGNSWGDGLAGAAPMVSLAQPTPFQV